MFDNEEIEVNNIITPGYINLPTNKTSSGLSIKEEEITHENVFQVAQEAYTAIIRKLNQLEMEYKGIKDEEVLQLMKNYQEQKQKIFEELDTMKDSDLSLIKLHTLARNMYMQLISWEELLVEHFNSIKKKKVANSSLTGSSAATSLTMSSKLSVTSSLQQQRALSVEDQDPDLSVSPNIPQNHSKSTTDLISSLSDSSTSSGSPVVTSSLSSNYLFFGISQIKGENGISSPPKPDAPISSSGSSNAVAFNLPSIDNSSSETKPSNALSTSMTNLHYAHSRRRSMPEKQLNELRSSKVSE